ncbi:hypothetical protein K504DRAFT_502101 [Pleomassaria siparia CBS 279.74]|uniref:Ketoreductase (KR) domain-containing protein n=1 Tax=Pleomassaria siparia CBS 279.74 TaxID=1314801 RepID=A0A6G1KA78_9PLEO|nr:hypothetical protein K504DRAFT_502101 [Pleomassaria siparia CBS 279.74]
MATLDSTGKDSVLITGCSIGSLGSALAKEIHCRGLHVIATAWPLTCLRELLKIVVQVGELAVTQSGSIKVLRAKVTSPDSLFNNAEGSEEEEVGNWNGIIVQVRSDLKAKVEDSETKVSRRDVE